MRRSIRFLLLVASLVFVSQTFALTWGRSSLNFEMNAGAVDLIAAGEKGAGRYMLLYYNSNPF